MGRPSDYTPETAAQICARLVEGQSLRSICKAEDMPCIATVFVWLNKHPPFAEQYAHARDAQADTLADEILDIADNASNDWMERQLKDGSTEVVVNQDHISRSRLMVDSRKWIASKLKPKKYGERIDHSLTGKDGGPIVISSTDAEL